MHPIAPFAPSADAFRIALRPLIGQVSVITLMPEGQEAGPMGMTLTSANALSTDPAMLIACINRTASLHSALRLGRVLGWQSLGASHQMVAERFAGKDGARGAARFDGADWRDEPHPQGLARLLVGAPLASAAVIETLADHASHTVVIARLLSLDSQPGAGALGYRNGAYVPFAA